MKCDGRCSGLNGGQGEDMDKDWIWFCVSALGRVNNRREEDHYFRQMQRLSD
jgi:hypothetical protein